MSSLPFVEQADLFEWLAVAESLSFEDFDFAAVAGDLFAGLLPPRAWAAREAIELTAAAGAKRFVVAPADPAGLVVTAATTMACVRVPDASRGGTSLSLARHVFDELGRQGLRICLLYRRLFDAPWAPRLGAAEPSQWIEWTTPCCETACRSGLLFSRGWQAGVSAHAAQVIHRYMGTLASGAVGAVAHEQENTPWPRHCT